MGTKHGELSSAVVATQPDWPLTDPDAGAADLCAEDNHSLASYIPPEIGHIGRDHQTALPRIAKDPRPYPVD